MRKLRKGSSKRAFSSGLLTTNVRRPVLNKGMIELIIRPVSAIDAKNGTQTTQAKTVRQNRPVFGVGLSISTRSVLIFKTGI